MKHQSPEEVITEFVLGDATNQFDDVDWFDLALAALEQTGAPRELFIAVTEARFAALEEDKS